MAQLSHVRGRIEAFEGNRAEELPLVVRRAVGFGQAVFVAVDLDEPPISVWRARPQFLAALLGRNSTVAESSSAGHIRRGRAAGIRRSVGPVAVVARSISRCRNDAVLAGGDVGRGVYRVAVSAGLFFVFRPAAAGGAAWPWVRFAVFVAAVSIGAWLMAAGSKGDKVRATEVEVLDYDVGNPPGPRQLVARSV